MDKLRQAAWTAIHKINRSTGFDEESDVLLMEAASVLREALGHSGEATDMVQEPMYISESCAERGCACHYSVEVDGEPVTVYSAPVRTKDLTDEEIFQFQKEIQYADVDPITFARAVIAADREKNK